MSKSKILGTAEEFVSAVTVEDYFNAKLLAINKMQTQVIMDTLRDLGKLRGEQKLGTLLDVGSGNGICTSLMAKYFERAIGVDYSDNQIKKAYEIGHADHVEFKVGAAENLPVADGSVDVITCIFSLHYYDLNKFIQECRRVLKPDGMALFYIEFLTGVASLEDDNLPPIVNEITEMRANCMVKAIEMGHPERLLLDDWKAMCDLIDWPKKKRVTREASCEMKLAQVQNYFLSIPIYAEIDPPKNPIMNAFKKIQSIWNLGNGEMAEKKVRAIWDAAVIVLM